jgi:hypothetical protein
MGSFLAAFKIISSQLKRSKKVENHPKILARFHLNLACLKVASFF